MSHFDTKLFYDKIIYSPCDDESSAFVQHFKTHKDKYKYKEYIYTSDNLFFHQDLFARADVVITNIPFSIQAKILRYFFDSHIDYILICGYAINMVYAHVLGGYGQAIKNDSNYSTFVR